MGVPCPRCNETNVKKYEYGGYWCSNCHNWCTTKEFTDLGGFGRLKMTVMKRH